MNPTDTYLAMFLGSKTSPQRKAWDALTEADRRVKEREGIAAWKAWVEKHHAAIVSIGGLGSVPGAAITAMMLGIAESVIGGFSTIVIQDALAFVLMIVTLLVRPQGLFGGQIL